MGAARKVLLIGWDGADWKAVNPLLDAGKMPALERFINEGVMGNIATLHPPLSPMLWTSIATGMRPFRHGILGFTEPDPHTGGIRPVSTISRKVKAIWNILNQKGLRSNVVGWWPSHPAEPINGVMVSNHFQQARWPMDKPWPMAPGTVHPERLAGPIGAQRVHPAEITAGQILPFVPRAAEIDQKKDGRLVMLTRILAECATVHACATAVMQREPWDFMAVYYDAVDHFGHGFMKYHPPRQRHIPEKDFELYRGVVEGGYRFHDMMLGVLLKLAGDDTTVILVSDHGFHPDHLRPAGIPHEPAGPAVEHGPYGIVAMKGPGIKKDELIFGASLLDITPTVLTLFGLPVGEDMDGKPLVQAFESAPVIETVPSWEEVEGESGLLPEDRRLDPVEAREAVNQLIALGYIEDPGEDGERAAAQTVREARYNLAQAYIDANRHGEALPLLEELSAAAPDELRFANRLAHCYQAFGNLSATRRTIEAMIETRARLAREAHRRLSEIEADRKKEADGDKEKKDDLTADEKAGKARENARQIQEIRRLRSSARPRKYWADYLLGSLRMAEDKPAAALEHLRRAEGAEPMMPDLHIQIGTIYLKLKQWADAVRVFSKALEIDPRSAHAYLGLCRSYLARRRNIKAANAALEAVGLLYYFPFAHYCLGIALHRTGDIPRALEALRVALRQNPNFADAHLRIAYIYGRRLGDREKAEHHRRRAKECRRRQKERKILPPTGSQAAALPPKGRPAEPAPFRGSGPDEPKETITVVSGLPRSGTSMIMQMLQAGGFRCLTDGARGADKDNPRGYFEFEKVKGLRADASWLPEARGKAVKIIAQLLPYLPDRFTYRILFVEREIEEILASQRRMLAGKGRGGARLSTERLAGTFSTQVRRIKAMLAERKIPTLCVSYRDTVEHPRNVAFRVNAFLGGGLDSGAMADTVDPALYRNRGRANPDHS